MQGSPPASPSFKTVRSDGDADLTPRQYRKEDRPKSLDDMILDIKKKRRKSRIRESDNDDSKERTFFFSPINLPKAAKDDGRAAVHSLTTDHQSQRDQFITSTRKLIEQLDAVYDSAESSATPVTDFSSSSSTSTEYRNDAIQDSVDNESKAPTTELAFASQQHADMLLFCEKSDEAATTSTINAIHFIHPTEWNLQQPFRQQLDTTGGTDSALRDTSSVRESVVHTTMTTRDNTQDSLTNTAYQSDGRQSEMQQQIMQLEAQLQSQMAMTEHWKMRYEKEAMALREQQVTLNNVKAQLERERVNYSSRLSELMNGLDIVESELKSERLRFAHEKTSLSHKLKRAKQSLQASREECSQYMERIEQLSAECNALRQPLSQHSEPMHPPENNNCGHLQRKIATQRKRLELKNIEIAGLKELLYKLKKSQQ